MTHPYLSYPSYVVPTMTNGPTWATANGSIQGGVKLPNVEALNGTYINKDLPFNLTYQSLPNPLVLYGGSVRYTSDELLLNAAASTPAPRTTYSWYTYGPGTYTPPSSGPTWNVVIPPTPGLVTFGCLVQTPGFSPVARTLTVEMGIRMDDVIMIGWINAAGVPINPAGVNPQIIADMPADGGSSPNAAAAARIAALAQNDDCADYASLSPSQIYTPTDKDYILDWMFKYAPNPDPQAVLPTLHTADLTDPTGFTSTSDFTTYAGYVDYPKFAGFIQDNHRYKLLNHFQAKYRVSQTNATQFNGAPIILQQGAMIGGTVNPTGLPPNLGPVLDLLADLPDPYNLPFLTADYANNTLLSPQVGPANGLIGPTPAVDHIAQCNDGSPDIPGIRAFNTLEGLDLTTPLFWQNIGSKITFKCGLATPTYQLPENYPTYYQYQNGLHTLTFTQAATPNGHFFANPYPFSTEPSYGLPPQGPGQIPLVPGAPCFPTIPGGRNGIATLPADPAAPIPAYTAP